MGLTCFVSLLVFGHGGFLLLWSRGGAVCCCPAEQRSLQLFVLQLRGRAVALSRKFLHDLDDCAAF
jgi:hypothetical protein